MPRIVTSARQLPDFIEYFYNFNLCGKRSDLLLTAADCNGRGRRVICARSLIDSDSIMKCAQFFREFRTILEFQPLRPQ